MSNGQLGGHGWEPGWASGRSAQYRGGHTAQLKACIYYQNLWETDAAVHTAAGGCGGNVTLASKLPARLLCVALWNPRPPAPCTCALAQEGLGGILSPAFLVPWPSRLCFLPLPCTGATSRCFAQGLLRGLNPGPGGQWAGLAASLRHLSPGARACAACQPQACHLLGDGLRGLSLSRNFSSR